MTFYPYFLDHRINYADVLLELIHYADDDISDAEQAAAGLIVIITIGLIGCIVKWYSERIKESPFIIHYFDCVNPKNQDVHKIAIAFSESYRCLCAPFWAKIKTNAIPASVYKVYAVYNPEVWKKEGPLSNRFEIELHTDIKFKSFKAGQLLKGTLFLYKGKPSFVIITHWDFIKCTYYAWNKPFHLADIPNFESDFDNWTKPDGVSYFDPIKTRQRKIMRGRPY